MEKIKYWRIKDEVWESSKSVYAVMMLIKMTQIGISDEKFREFADSNLDAYKLFTKN